MENIFKWTQYSLSSLELLPSNKNKKFPACYYLYLEAFIVSVSESIIFKVIVLEKSRYPDEWPSQVSLTYIDPYHRDIVVVLVGFCEQVFIHSGIWTFRQTSPQLFFIIINDFFINQYFVGLHYLWNISYQHSWNSMFLVSYQKDSRTTWEMVCQW